MTARSSRSKPLAPKGGIHTCTNPLSAELALFPDRRFPGSSGRDAEGDEAFHDSDMNLELRNLMIKVARPSSSTNAIGKILLPVAQAGLSGSNQIARTSRRFSVLSYSVMRDLRRRLEDIPEGDLRDRIIAKLALATP